MKYRNTYLSFILLNSFNSPLTFANEITATPKIDHDGADYYSAVYENDLYYLGDDEGYTHGSFWSWGYNDRNNLAETLPSWIDYLTDKTYLTSYSDRQYNHSYTVAHLIQTPSDFESPALIEDDLPYVSLAAWQAKVGSYSDHTKDNISLLLGMVGPITYGEEMQKAIHSMIGSPDPMGWDHQIDNEFVFQIKADRMWRVYETAFESTEFDVLTGVVGAVGNYRSEAGSGIGIRWGQQLRQNFSSASVFPNAKFNNISMSPHGWYLFANTSTHYVLNDIFIDGNTFSDSHSAELTHFQLSMSIGVMVNFYNWNLAYSMLYQSDEFEDQKNATKYGSVSLGYSF